LIYELLKECNKRGKSMQSGEAWRKMVPRSAKGAAAFDFPLLL